MKSIFLRTMSASTLFVVALSLQPTGMNLLVTPAAAQASVSASIDINTFYTGLADDGTWTHLNGRYVWVPNDIDDSWRPYTRGHWVATRDYGWVWVSNERFGWATYHYGRWGYDDAIGWYWVPGNRWAPAWVAWSRNDDTVAWAPLPPRYDDRGDASITVNISDVPDYYWDAVPAQAFLSINISNDIIRDRNRVRTVVQSQPPQTVVIQNNIVINNAIDPNFIAQRTGKKIEPVKVDVATSPDQATKPSANGNSVTIFNPPVKAQPDAKPQVVQDPNRIATDRKDKGIKPIDKGGAQDTNAATPPPPPAKPGATTDGAAVPKPDLTKPQAGQNTTPDQTAPADKNGSDASKTPPAPTKPPDNAMKKQPPVAAPAPAPAPASAPDASSKQTVPPKGQDLKKPVPPQAAPDAKQKPKAPPPPPAPMAKAPPPPAPPAKAPPPPAPKAEAPKTPPPTATAKPPEPPKAPPAAAKPAEPKKAACDPQKEKCD